nr:AraC family transcriptional regulator [uncultured Acetatifactor sp.]
MGYPDIYHFSKIFKKHFGLSPRNYQQMYRRSRG